jgi:enamine deaminase RidA (YjgF/YER057c/UK114 family)
MATQGRINVSSGRPLESRAQYSRALRAGSLVIQSGTTAIDREGNILGDDVVTQTNAILSIAAESMAAAMGAFENVVRARLYVKGTENIAPAAAVFDRAFSEICPAITVIPITALARPTQLIEIELEAVDSAAAAALHFDSQDAASTNFGGSTAVRIADQILIAGIAPTAASAADRVQQALSSIASAVGHLNGAMDDLVAIKFFTTDLSEASLIFAEFERICPAVHPVVSLIGVPVFGAGSGGLIVEAEAIAGAASRRTDTPHPWFQPFSATVGVDDRIYISNIVPLDPSGAVCAPGDWAGQHDRATKYLEAVLQKVGASLDDVVVRRYFTRTDADMNRDYGDGPAWFESTRPAALGCRIVAHPNDEALISIESYALRGAGNDIDWRTLPLAPT